MGLFLAAARLYLPRSVRKSRLDQLVRAAADAFECDAPHLKDISLNQRLKEFALFTAENAAVGIRQGKGGEIKKHLYINARSLGLSLRREMKLKSQEEVLKACRVIYRALNIDFRGDLRGQIVIPRCYFSLFYSPEICRVISGLDEGLIAGISGGFKLEFSQKITEGNDCCKAKMFPAGSSF